MTEKTALSPLLSLPAELRNTIWTLVLVQSEQALPNHLFPGAPPRRQDRICANVLRTCRQVNNEATPIFYGENTFTAHPTLLATLPSLLLLTRPHRVSLPPVKCPRMAKLIRRWYIHVRLDTDPQFGKELAEDSFNGVEELEIEVFQSMYGSCDFSKLKLFEGVRGVGRAVVQGSIGDGKYACWLADAMMKTEGTLVEPYTELYIGGDKAWSAWQNGNR